MIHVDATLAFRIVVEYVQGPIAETSSGIRLPADPFTAIEIAVVASNSVASTSNRIAFGWSRGVHALNSFQLVVRA
jgi:hypothetical protein